MANPYSFNVARRIPEFLSPPQFPSALFDAVRDPYAALKISQEDLRNLRKTLDEQCRDISVKVDRARSILSNLNRARSKVNKALDDIGHISEQRIRAHSDLLREDYGPSAAGGKRPRVLMDVPDEGVTLPDALLRSPVHRRAEHVAQQDLPPYISQTPSYYPSVDDRATLDIDVEMNTAFEPSVQGPISDHTPFLPDNSFALSTEQVVRHHQLHQSTIELPETPSFPTAESQFIPLQAAPLCSTLVTTESVTSEPILPVTTTTPQDMGPNTTNEPSLAISNNICPQPEQKTLEALRYLQISPETANLNHEWDEASDVIGGATQECEPVETIPPCSDDNKLVLNLSSMTRRWRTWKMKELESGRQSVNHTQYRDEKNPQYSRMDPITLFKKVVMKKRRSVPEEEDLDRGHGICRSKKSSRRHDPMQKTLRRTRAPQVHGTKHLSCFDPNGPEVTSLLNSILVEAEVNDLASYLGSLAMPRVNSF